MFCFFLSHIGDRAKDPNLVAVVAVFPLVLEALFPQHGRLRLVRLLGLLLLLFLHVIGQLAEEQGGFVTAIKTPESR